MGAVYFYHLTRQPVEATLPQLLGRALQAGWRIAVRGTQAERMSWLDERLWLGDENGFMPHGLAGGTHDADQPILLSVGAATAANTPDCLMCMDGAEVTPDEVQASQRVCILFDGNDPQAVDRARAQWRDLTGAGCGAKYWSEDSGRWEMKAESAGKDSKESPDRDQ